MSSPRSWNRFGRFWSTIRISRRFCQWRTAILFQVRESFYFLFLGFIAWLNLRIPHEWAKSSYECPKTPRVDYDSVTMSKNALGIWYESRTIFRIGEFVAKVLNSSKLLGRIPDRPTNCKNSLRTVRIS